MWCVSSAKVMVPAGSFLKSSAGGTKIRSGAVRMLSTERFATKVSGRGGVKLDNDGGVTFMVAVGGKAAHADGSDQLE